MNWTPIYNRLFPLLDIQGETYFSGPRFTNTVIQFDPFQMPYGPFMDERRVLDKSTTRRDYFRDILNSLDEERRLRVLSSILSECETAQPDKVSEIRGFMGGNNAVPSPTLPVELWKEARLSEYLEIIDTAIQNTDYERAVAVSYTCLEGFMGAFVRAKQDKNKYAHEINELSKEVRDYLAESVAGYPPEIIKLTTTIPYAIDRARNKFSEAHFGGEAGRWLAIYVRDLVNTQIRLLVHFV